MFCVEGSEAGCRCGVCAVSSAEGTSKGAACTQGQGGGGGCDSVAQGLYIWFVEGRGVTPIEGGDANEQAVRQYTPQSALGASV